MEKRSFVGASEQPSSAHSLSYKLESREALSSTRGSASFPLFCDCALEAGKLNKNKTHNKTDQSPLLLQSFTCPSSWSSWPWASRLRRRSAAGRPWGRSGFILKKKVEFFVSRERKNDGDGAFSSSPRRAPLVTLSGVLNSPPASSRGCPGPPTSSCRTCPWRAGCGPVEEKGSGKVFFFLEVK